jgi:hypothetical protein
MKVKAMTNAECLMSKERRNPNAKTYCAALAYSSSTRALFVIRALLFGAIRVNSRDSRTKNLLKF